MDALWRAILVGACQVVCLCQGSGQVARLCLLCSTAVLVAVQRSLCERGLAARGSAATQAQLQGMCRHEEAVKLCRRSCRGVQTWRSSCSSSSCGVRPDRDSTLPRREVPADSRELLRPVLSPSTLAALVLGTAGGIGCRQTGAQAA